MHINLEKLSKHETCFYQKTISFAGCLKQVNTYMYMSEKKIKDKDVTEFKLIKFVETICLFP